MAGDKGSLRPAGSVPVPAEGDVASPEQRIISDAEIARVHGRANFGAMSPREVVNDGVRKIATGYHTGHTQFCILREHGLITKPRGMSYDANLTKKGKRYARSLGWLSLTGTAPTLVEGTKRSEVNNNSGVNQ